MVSCKGNSKLNNKLFEFQNSNSFNFVLICDADVVKDEPTNNVPDLIFTKLGLQLHRRDDHPLGILKNTIYNYFDTNYNNQFHKFDDLSPIVSTTQVSTGFHFT